MHYNIGFVGIFPKVKIIRPKQAFLATRKSNIILPTVYANEAISDLKDKILYVIQSRKQWLTRRLWPINNQNTT